MLGYKGCFFPFFLFVTSMFWSGFARGESAENYLMLRGGWEYRWGETSPWVALPEAALPRTPPGRMKNQFLHFRTRLPEKLPRDSVLFLGGAKHAIEVRMAEKVLYRWWPVSARGDGCGFEGFPMHEVALPDSAAGQEIELTICSGERGIGLYGDVAITDSVSLVKRLMSSSLFVIIIAFILCIIGVLGGVSFLLTRRPEYLWFLAGCLAIGIYVFCRAPARSLFIADPLLSIYLELVALSSAVVTWVGFIDTVLVRTWRDLGAWIWRTAGWFLCLAFCGHIVGLISVSELIVAIQISILVTFSVALLLSLREAMRGNAEARLFVIAAVSVSGFGCIDVLISLGIVFPQFQGKLTSTPFGALVVVGCFVYLLSMRISDFYYKLQGRNRAFESLVGISESMAMAASHGALSERYVEGVWLLTGQKVDSALRFTPYAFGEEESLAPGLYTFRREEIAESVMEGQPSLTVHDPDLDCPLVMLPVPDSCDRSVLEPLTNTVLSCLTRLRLETVLRQLFERNVEMQVILKSINQVILMIDSNLRILADYSSMVTEVFPEQNIEGSFFPDLVLAQSSLTDEDRLQCRLRLEAALGDSWHSFRINLPGLPTEIGLLRGDRILRFLVSWVPVLDSDGTVERVIVAMRDVTEERHLELTTSQRNQDLAVLTTIVRLPLFELTRFLASAQQLCHNWSVQPLFRDAVTELRRDLHTIKGNARTLGFASLSAEIHRIEDRVTEICSQSNDEETARALLRQEVREIENELVRFGDLARQRNAFDAQNPMKWDWARGSVASLLERTHAGWATSEELSGELRRNAEIILRKNTDLTVSSILGRFSLAISGDDALLAPEGAAIFSMLVREWLVDVGDEHYDTSVTSIVSKVDSGILVRLMRVKPLQPPQLRWIEWLVAWVETEVNWLQGTIAAVDEKWWLELRVGDVPCFSLSSADDVGV